MTVYGLWHDQTLLDRDKSLLHSTVSYKAGINLLDSNSLYSIKIRVARKIGRELVKRFQIETIAALGYNFDNYLKLLVQEDADLYIGHEEMSMALAEQLLKKGKNVAFDFEDWHSMDLLPQDRAFRPLKLLKRLEDYLLKNSCYAYTTSQIMALSMAKTYNSDPPKVIYNSFPFKERARMDGMTLDRQDNSKPSLYWFSQVISEGRGLELLLEGLKETKTPMELHLRGAINKSYQLFLENQAPSHVDLYIHLVVPYEDLISRIAEHDLGIAFEETTPESRNLTITNKVFHYLQSGIAILATETAGQNEIAKLAPQAIAIVDTDAKALAFKMDSILSNPELLQTMKKASWEAGQTQFAFENQAEQLKEFINAL